MVITNTVVVGLGFGDEGKGSIVDYLCRTQGFITVARYNGGCQAGHHVVLEDNRWHCFRQFGSGSIVGMRTYLSDRVFVDPKMLMEEEMELKELGIRQTLGKLRIHSNTPVIFPFNVYMNRIKEMTNRVGTVGMGVGDAIFDHKKGIGIFFKDLLDDEVLLEKITNLLDEKRRQISEIDGIPTGGPLGKAFLDDEYLLNPHLLATEYSNYGDYFKDCIVDDYSFDGKTVFEGAQGVLLDYDYGFFPYVTKSSTLSKNASKLCKDIGHTLGVIRGYGTRHGPGPFPTEITDSRLIEKLTDNYDNPWQGPFRVGWLDLILLKYALKLNPVDSIAVTNLDRLVGISPKVCYSYKYTGDRTDIDKYFIVNGNIITGFRPEPMEPQNEDMTSILMDCVPFEFKSFPTFDDEKLYTIKSVKDIPEDVRVYLSFIEKSLGVPIKIVSVGPSWLEKVMVAEL